MKLLVLGKNGTKPGSNRTQVLQSVEESKERRKREEKKANRCIFGHQQI
jgi:hypothetical protein